MLRGTVTLELTLTSGNLLALATDLTSCFVTGIVVTLVDTTDAVEFDITVSFPGLLMLGAEVVNGTLVVPIPGELEHFARALCGGFLEGNEAGTTATR